MWHHVCIHSSLALPLQLLWMTIPCPCILLLSRTTMSLLLYRRTICLHLFTYPVFSITHTLTCHLLVWKRRDWNSWPKLNQETLIQPVKVLIPVVYGSISVLQNKGKRWKVTNANYSKWREKQVEVRFFFFVSMLVFLVSWYSQWVSTDIQCSSSDHTSWSLS
jgi:hypothetical protein